MITREFEFSNGDFVVDSITEFKGTITGTCFYITGCNRYLIEAKTEGNKEPVSLWLNEDRIKLLWRSE